MTFPKLALVNFVKEEPIFMSCQANLGAIDILILFCGLFVYAFWMLIFLSNQIAGVITVWMVSMYF